MKIAVKKLRLTVPSVAAFARCVPLCQNMRAFILLLRLFCLFRHSVGKKNFCICTRVFFFWADNQAHIYVQHAALIMVQRAAQRVENNNHVHAL